MNIQTIGVVGAGQMGHGIAQVCAMAGFPVLLQDLSQDLLARALAAIDRNLTRKVDKGKLLMEEKPGILARIRTTTSLGDFKDVDLIIEAAVERWEVKKPIFETLDVLCSPGVIFATTTSSLSITRLAALTKRPELVIGMHFMNPVPVLPLVEIVRGLATSDATCEMVSALSERLDKTPIQCNDAPGFVSNRLLMLMINEAVFTLQEGVAEVQAIDEIIRLGLSHPMGPLALADFIGLDACLTILTTLYDGLGDPKYRPCPLLVRYVDAGWLGKKSGRGFYDYTEE